MRANGLVAAELCIWFMKLTSQWRNANSSGWEAKLTSASTLRISALFIGPAGWKLAKRALWIAVSAPHRRAAFEACEWAIKELKRTVPIWKKEFSKTARFGLMEKETLERGKGKGVTLLGANPERYRFPFHLPFSPFSFA